MAKNKKSKIKQMMELKGDFIVGIHNYCDRWCERCELNNRCRIYANEKENPHDSDNFLEELSETFADVKDMLKESIEEQGMDFEKFKEEALADAEAKEEIDWHQHPLAKRAGNYQKQARNFFDKHNNVFENKEQEMNQMLNIGVGEKEIQRDAEVIKDCFEIINWYLFFIEIKLIRALSSREDDKDEEDVKEYPSDSDGSCKVSLIAMDNTIRAWEKLLVQFPDLSDECVDILSLITSLRSDVEKEFPDARSFVRTGFDTGGK